MGSIISARMLPRLGAFYPAAVTIQAATLTRDAFGEPRPAWADVSGLTDLPGQLAPAAEDKLQRLGLTVERTTHVLALGGHYPTITPAQQALVDGTAYEITGVRHDSQGVQTYLGLKLSVASA